MSNLINAMRQKDAFTANGALTNSTSLNAVVDMFFLAGASRRMSEQEIINVFVKAYNEDPNLAVKCLFWALDSLIRVSYAPTNIGIPNSGDYGATLYHESLQALLA